ncbi:MAG: Aminoglycoside phosphotransferase, partial [Klenkia sp.]|nr:Aminoglycoside phosphotransferase [Klenkia sp.]
MSTPAGAAVAAAVACAGRLGLSCAEPRLLSDGVNAVVHLAPAPVVARVATTTRLLRPDVARTFGREVELATALAVAGAAVVPPSDLLPPGPHRQDGLVLSFWRFAELTGEQPTAQVVGRALGELHEVLATLLPPAGTLLDTPLDDVAAFAATGVALGARPDLVVRVGDLLAELRPRLSGPPGALHGDAHPGNLLGTTAGWRWTDLEDTSPGPVGWDLACLRSTGRLDGRAAVDATPGPLSDADLAPLLLLRMLHGAAWSQVV